LLPPARAAGAAVGDVGVEETMPTTSSARQTAEKERERERERERGGGKQQYGWNTRHMVEARWTGGSI
jgi:hypothetical protein